MNKNKIVNWDDPNVLRTLSDGWYNVPADSGYAKQMMWDPWLKDGDTRDLAEKRHQDEQDKNIKPSEKMIVRFVIMHMSLG